MLKILLALDDYQEQIYLHRLLTKMGFNVEVTQTDQAIGGLIMVFQPQVVFIAEKSRKINSVKLVSDIRSKRKSTQFVLLKQGSQEIQTELDKLVNTIVPSPVHPEDLFSAISEVSHLSKPDLLSKFEKLSNSIKNSRASSEESQYVQGGKVKAETSEFVKGSNIKSSVSNEQRAKKYKDFLSSVKSIEKNETTFERDKIKRFNKELRSQSEFHESPELKVDKLQYTKSLLKKNK